MRSTENPVNTLPFTEREHRIVKSITNILIKHLHPSRILLFGSRVKDRFHKNADFDFAVDVERADLRTHRMMMEDIESAAGLYGIDIVYLKSVDEEFRQIILQTGFVLYDGTP